MTAQASCAWAPATRPLRLIVAATDFTPAAAAAARRAAAIAEAAGARLALFHAQRTGDAEKARERLRLGAARLRRGTALSDLSPRATAALQAARRLFPGADIHVVHACPPLYEGTLHFTGVGSDLVAAYRRQALAIGERRLTHFMAKSRAGTGVRAATRLGAPAAAIREYAHGTAADVVVLSPGKSWVARAVGSSVSEQVLADPPCDILLAA